MRTTTRWITGLTICAFGLLGWAPPAVNFAATNAARQVVTQGKVTTVQAARANPGAKSLSAISFISSSVGFMAANNGIYKTVDGGKSWSNVYFSSDPVLGVQAKYQPVGGEDYVLAYTRTKLLVSTNGRTFVRTTMSNGNGSLQGVSLLDNGVSYVILNGRVLASNPMNGAFERKTPSEPVESISMVADDIGYAASGNAVYKTTDHGNHWVKVFAPSLSQGPWKTQIEANGPHVAVLFYGGDAGMNQSAYVLFASQNAGKTWKAIVDEGYFAPDYKRIHPVNPIQVGLQPGPFTVLPSGEILMLGLDVHTGERVSLTGILASGKTALQYPVGLTSAWHVFDFPRSSLSLFALDANRVWIGGSNLTRAVVMTTHNGGSTWLRVQ